MAKRGPKPHPTLLTPRETEVLALIRDGLTNAQIADRLNISPETAKYHVSEILSKLNVATRDEAAAWREPTRESWPPRRWAVALGGAAVVTATIAALAVLTWGTLRAGDGDEPFVASDFLSTEQAVPSASCETNQTQTPASPGPLVSYPAKTLDEIFSEIAEKVPGFGGSFFSPDPSERVVYMYFTEPTQQKADEVMAIFRRDYSAHGITLGGGDEARALQGNYDFRELRCWYDLIYDGGEFEGLAYGDIQEADNRLEFGVETPEAQANLRATLEDLGVPDDAAVVKVSGPFVDD